MFVWETKCDYTIYHTYSGEPRIPPHPPEHSTRLGIDICLSESNFLVSQPLSAFRLHLITEFFSFKLSDGGKIASYYTLNCNSLIFSSPPGMNRRRTWEDPLPGFAPSAAYIRGLWQYLLSTARINIQLKCRHVVHTSHLQ